MLFRSWMALRSSRLPSTRQKVAPAKDPASASVDAGLGIALPAAECSNWTLGVLNAGFRPSEQQIGLARAPYSFWKAFKVTLSLAGSKSCGGWQPLLRLVASVAPGARAASLPAASDAPPVTLQVFERRLHFPVDETCKPGTSHDTAAWLGNVGGAVATG